MLQPISCSQELKERPLKPFGLCQSHSWFERKIGSADHYRVGRRGPWQDRLYDGPNQSGKFWKVRLASRISKSSCLLPRILMKMERPSKTNQVWKPWVVSWTIWLWLLIQMMGPRNFRSDPDDSSRGQGIGVPSRLLDWNGRKCLSS